MLPSGFYFIEGEARPPALSASGEDPALAIARLIVESGRAYFTAFYGSEAQAIEHVARCLVRPNSAFSATKLSVLCTGSSIAGCLVAFPGAELEKRQRADLAFVLQSFSAATRAEMINRLRGRVFVSAQAEPDDFYVRAFTVAASFRGQKLGQVLLQRALELAQRSGATVCKLDVYDSNIPAVRLYRAAGFVPVATMQDPAAKDCISTMARAVSADAAEHCR